MNSEFMSGLRAASVSLSLRGDVVEFSAPRGVLSAELLGILRCNKDAIREFLRRFPAHAEQSPPAPPITKAPRELLESQLAYWKKQLAGAPPALELPTDRPRPPLQTYRGAALPVALSRELSAALVALSRREGVTLFMTLLAALQMLLQRYTGKDDIVVGSPIAGRTPVETEGLVGFFVNTLVLRTDLSGDPSVKELLGRVREVTLAAYANQLVPLEKPVEELSPVRDPSRSPLFQVMLVLQNAPLPSPGKVKLGPVEVGQTAAKLDLSLSLAETEEGLRGALEYNTDLFDAATIQRMLGHYLVLLEGMVSSPMLGRRGESPLVAIRPTGARRPFFCVHPANGGVLCYEPLARALGPEQPFYGLQARAVEPGDDAQGTVEAMAGRYLEAIREAQPEGPYQLGGWSFGGYVAFEMARRLKAEGHDVAALVLMDTWLPDGVRAESEHQIAVSMAACVATECALPLTEEELRQLDVAAILARTGEGLEEAGWLPKGHGVLTARRYFSTYRATLLAATRYVPGPLLGSLTLLRARDPGDVPDASFEWGRLCSRPITVRSVPGDHHDMVRPPHVEVLARALLDLLDSAGGALR